MIIFSADLSMNCPGFAVQSYDESTYEVKVLNTFAVDNKNTSKKTHGLKLKEIYSAAKETVDKLVYEGIGLNNILFVRERPALYVRHAEAIVVNKVYGVQDYMLELISPGMEWKEIPPTSIKKIITGNGKATKKQVADKLADFVGGVEYKHDDESDAVAAGIAWLIKTEHPVLTMTTTIMGEKKNGK